MRIVGFGDSFIVDNELDYTYTSLIQQHFQADCAWYGHSGSGAWDAFFNFLDRREECDVVIFAWSAEHRTYHPDYHDICPSIIDERLGTDPVWEAAKQYYTYLYDCRKAYYEHVALYRFIDDYLHDNYPDTKVIHMWGFPGGNQYTKEGQLINHQPYEWNEADKFSYLYRFKHGVEIRPALINLSYREEWPGDLRYETRPHHLSNNMHSYLSKYVIDAIENYSPGRLIDIP